MSTEEPLQLISRELAQVASTLRAHDTHHGRRSRIADELDAHQQALAGAPDEAAMAAVAAELKKLAKELVPDDAVSARNLAEACLRLMKLAGKHA
jgi:hypothetical protein